MRKSLLLLIALVFVLSMTASAVAQVGPLPTQAGQIGTSPVQRNLDVNNQPLITKRVGVIAYCADMAPRAAAVGIFSWPHQPLEVFPSPNGWGNPNSSPTGFFGAQNIVDMLMYDDEIPRFRDVVLIDGDRDLPTAQDLIRNFDCVIAYTDNKCGVPIPTTIADSAAAALSGFLAAGTPTAPKGAVLTGFAFNRQIGFGNVIFGQALSPIRKTSAGLDARCQPNDPCIIGFCPAPSERMFAPGGSAPACFNCPALTCDPATDPNCCDPANPAPGCAVTPLACTQTQVAANLYTCLDTNNVFCGQPVNPVNQPTNIQPDRVCQSLWKGVNGPTSSSYANAFQGNPLLNTATLCGNYLSAPDLPLIAANQARNIVALNVFPGYAPDLQKTWFSCILANAAIYACGERRCRAPLAGEACFEFCDATGANCSCCN